MFTNDGESWGLAMNYMDSACFDWRWLMIDDDGGGGVFPRRYSSTPRWSGPWSLCLWGEEGISATCSSRNRLGTCCAWDVQHLSSQSPGQRPECLIHDHNSPLLPLLPIGSRFSRAPHKQTNLTYRTNEYLSARFRTRQGPSSPLYFCAVKSEW